MVIFHSFLYVYQNIPSGYLTLPWYRWPIYRWFTWVYVLKMVIFHGELLNNQRVPHSFPTPGKKKTSCFLYQVISWWSSHIHPEVRHARAAGRPPSVGRTDPAKRTWGSEVLNYHRQQLYKVSGSFDFDDPNSFRTWSRPIRHPESLSITIA